MPAATTTAAIDKLLGEGAAPNASAHAKLVADTVQRVRRDLLEQPSIPVSDYWRSRILTSLDAVARAYLDDSAVLNPSIGPVPIGWQGHGSCVKWQAVMGGDAPSAWMIGARLMPESLGGAQAAAADNFNTYCSGWAAGLQQAQAALAATLDEFGRATGLQVRLGESSQALADWQMTYLEQASGGPPGAKPSWWENLPGWVQAGVVSGVALVGLGVVGKAVSAWAPLIQALRAPRR